MNTVYNQEISDWSIGKYIERLVNRFYKILPLTENKCETVNEYMLSLQRELLGCQSLFVALGNDDQYISILSLLQYLIEHQDEDFRNVRKEIFQVINVLNKLKNTYLGDKG